MEIVIGIIIGLAIGFFVGKLMEAKSAELAPSRLERAPQMALTKGVALDSEKAQISPNRGTLVSI